jgi:hypothetical protein
MRYAGNVARVREKSNAYGVSAGKAEGNRPLLSRVGVNYKTGFALDDWIYCTLYIHNSGLRAIRLYR